MSVPSCAPGSPPSSTTNAREPDHLEFHEDLTAPGSVDGFLKEADLIHLASAHDHLSDDVLQTVNVAGTEALVAKAERNASERFQFINVASAVIGVPVTATTGTPSGSRKIVPGSTVAGRPPDPGVRPR